jgi:uncharacterized protein (TIGR03790 family)
MRARSVLAALRCALAAGAVVAAWAAVAGEPPAAAGDAQAPTGAASAAASAPADEPPRRWIAVPRVEGRLTAADIGLVVNTADPYSVEVGRHYAAKRGLRPEQVLEVELPLQPQIDLPTFEALRARIDGHFGDRAQALALAWAMPYAVQCHSITGALALGVDPELCRRTCGRTPTSPYLNSPSSQPLRDHGMRLSMLLAAPSAEQAMAMIDRGVAADGTLGLRGAPPVQALFVQTRDRARNVRSPLFPPPGLLARVGVDVVVVGSDDVAGRERVVLLQTGAARVPELDTLRWVDGALADHLTSAGGRLEGRGGQMPATAWIAAGATASYGTVSEPCNHVPKFPHPQLLLLHYLQGSTAIEAYWRSVAWPAQGLFIGEPLAAPFARRP